MGRLTGNQTQDISHRVSNLTKCSSGSFGQHGDHLLPSLQRYLVTGAPATPESDWITDLGYSHSFLQPFRPKKNTVISTPPNHFRMVE